MIKGFFKTPTPANEPVLSYAPDSPEAKKLKEALQTARSETKDIPMIIGSEEVRTEKQISMHPPHNHQHLLGHYHEGDAGHVKQAIAAALGAKPAWDELPWNHRAAIFLRAADLISGEYRYKINAATMLAQSKNCYQAEIDAACEFADFLRFNVQYMTEIYNQQPPVSPDGVWNRVEQRALEGFIFAITPFNFTAIAGNLCAAPALMGNTIVWKPNETQIYSAAIIMEIFKKAGLPDGVINLIFVDGPTAGDVIFSHRDFAGLHFTGSTKVFQHLWKTIGTNIEKYKTYPRIVGETGGKDFIVAHHSAEAEVVAAALLRGAFEYQGQKCSAASRAYIPQNLWPAVQAILHKEMDNMKMGPTEDFSNFINAVISEAAFDRIVDYIEDAKNTALVTVEKGGTYDKSKGYFISPTLLVTKDPMSRTMVEEIFGPVLTVYIYNENYFEETLELIDQTSDYALTGAIIATDPYAKDMASKKLQHAAGNFYINDKCTGAVVGQQPFGGSRGSGTNDKAGSMINLLRWVSPRTIKEVFKPVKDYRYPFLGE